MFRRECFEEIGGYQAIKSGGIDLIAVLSARVKGWETRTFVEKSFVHHRTQGGALHQDFVKGCTWAGKIILWGTIRSGRSFEAFIK